MKMIKMGMVGGGEGAFIGAIHRMAAVMDGQIELVCGAFSSDPERSKRSGAELSLAKERCYGSYDEMLQKEASLNEDERMDFVSIVTPNHLHFPVAKAALEKGFHVMSDKPATFNVSEARDLRSIVKETKLLYGLTHNYIGYPMVKEARERIRRGDLGEIRKVVVEYPQGWLSTMLESEGQKQAEWRTDPERSGASGCMGDIGTHAENLLQYMTGLEITELCADLSTLVEGRRLDDDGNVLLRLSNGARGILYASQISVGDENNLSIRVYGSKGGLEWHQIEPNTLLLKSLDTPTQILRTGANFPWLSENAKKNTRTPAGHPEGYIEAFANHYRNFANAIRRWQSDMNVKLSDDDVPGIEDGVRGMLFIEALLASSKSDRKWTKCQKK